MSTNITIIAGTNRNDAVSLQVAKYYSKLLTQLGAEHQIIDLKDLPSDFTQTALYENSGKNAAFNTMRETMLQSEKFVFVVPEYNGSFPGVLKAFIDGLIFPHTFKGKKCALVGISSGVQGAGLALSHLTDIFNYCGMHVLALKPKLSHIEKNFGGEEFENPLYKQLLDDQSRDIVRF